jgi:hypothetical protein
MREKDVTARSLTADEFRVAKARQRGIGRELRRRYDAVTHERLPDDLAELLNRIDAAHSDGGQSDTPPAS